MIEDDKTAVNLVKELAVDDRPRNRKEHRAAMAQLRQKKKPGKKRK